MALVTVEGTYRDGKVELAEQPDGVEGARVIVTFLTSNGAERSVVDRDAATETASIPNEEREQAVQRVIEDMESGLNLGGGPYYTVREELYEERLKRFDR